VLNSCDVCQADIEKVVVKAIQQFICESILKKKNQFVKKSISCRERRHLACEDCPGDLKQLIIGNFGDAWRRGRQDACAPD
jgi:hypothetical protein